MSHFTALRAKRATVHQESDMKLHIIIIAMVWVLGYDTGVWIKMPTLQ